MYRTSPMLFIASLRCHVRVPACTVRRLGRPGQQCRKEAKKPSRIVAILVLRSVTGQPCYRSYRYPYTLVLLKWSHCRLFCPSRAHWEAKKAAVVRKSCQNFWTKRLQQKPHDWNLENAIKKTYETSLETYKRGIYVAARVVTSYYWRLLEITRNY